MRYDDARNIEPGPTQSGFVNRSDSFRVDRQPGQPYRPEGVTYVGNFRVSFIIIFLKFLKAIYVRIS